jgi:hypothetical protein
MACQAREFPSSIIDIEDLANQQTLAIIRSQSEHCGCSKCAACCSRVPGSYDPHHLKMLIEGKSQAEINEIFEKITKDYLLDDNDQAKFYLRPAIRGEKPGLASFNMVTGPCINLGPSGCKLSRQEMPIGCVSAMPCNREKSISVDKQEAEQVWHNECGHEIMSQYDKYILSNFPGALISQNDLEKEISEIKENPVMAMMSMMSMFSMMSKN